MQRNSNSLDMMRLIRRRAFQRILMAQMSVPDLLVLMLQSERLALGSFDSVIQAATEAHKYFNDIQTDSNFCNCSVLRMVQKRHDICSYSRIWQHINAVWYELKIQIKTSTKST